MKWAWALALTLALAGCGTKTQPQRPTHKGEVRAQDSALLRLMMLNERLADEADRQVQRYIKAQAVRAYQMDCGAWKEPTRSRFRNDTVVPKKGETWFVEWQAYTLQDSMLEHGEQAIRYLVDPIPSALQEAMAEMHHGDSTRLICPWYTAFGPAGTMTIKPYTNCIIELTIQ